MLKRWVKKKINFKYPFIPFIASSKARVKTLGEKEINFQFCILHKKWWDE